MSTEQIKVLVNGACGRMGQAVVEAVIEAEGMNVTAFVDLCDDVETKAKALLGNSASNTVICKDLSEGIDRSNPDVVVDFTNPTVVYENISTIINKNVRPVIGTTGLTIQQVEELTQKCVSKNLGGLIAPNFAIGAVLMMQFAQKSAKYFDHAEIIELHHNKKLDAPSGTAIKTAEMMENEQEKFGPTNINDKELMQGARGAVSRKNIHLHSVRLPGLVAHQEVLLAGSGQMLTIRHDSFDRKSFMPGVVLAVRNVMSQSKLIYGLEYIL